MKNSLTIIFSLVLIFQCAFSHAQTSLNYTYNGHIDVKQGTALAKLKNPFVGGFDLPQFSTIDLDLDGKLDLLIFDRATKRFYTFINDGIPNTVSYTYAPQYQYKFPRCNNFCLTYDYNNDGKMDLFVEANGIIEQYRNTSSSILTFDPPDYLYDYFDPNVANPKDSINIYCPSTNIPSFNDIDNDGDMDILTWDPFGFTINLYKNWRVEKGLPNNSWKYKLADECWGKFYLDNSIHLGYACKGLVYWPYGDDYTPPPAPAGAEAHQGSTLLTFDVDSDGDYDALLGDIFYNYLFFLKNGKKDFSYPKDSMIAKDSLYPSAAERMEVNNFPAAYFLDVNNDGKRDIILAPNDESGASKNKDQIYFYKNIGTDRKPKFTLVQKDFLQETTIDLGGFTSPSFVDIDNDGDDDLFLASHGEATATLNSHDLIAYYKNIGTLLNPVFELQDANFLNLSVKGYSGIKPCFGDLNGDGKKDLLFGESNGYLKYYLNTTIGSNPSFTENTTQFSGFQGINYSSPCLVDYNRDGKLDLFLGNQEGTISYFQNTGTTTNPVFTKQVDSVGKICLRYVDESRVFHYDGASSPVVTDLDKDGKFDLLVGGKFGLYKYMNIENKMSDSLTLLDTVVRFGTSQLSVMRPTGFYISPAIANLDSDSVYLDIMLGNNGGGLSLFSTYEYKNKSGIIPVSESKNIIKIFPNPATGSISIEGVNEENYTLYLYDVTGKQILEEKYHARQSPVDIKSLQQGIYFVNLVTANGKIFNGKFVKL